MRVPTCLKPLQLKNMIREIFDAEIHTQRSSLISCPSCRAVDTCTVSCASRWPLWFHCPMCRFSGDLLTSSARQLGIIEENTGAELLRIQPELDLARLESEHQGIVDHIQDVNRRWSEVRRAQNLDLDIRSRKVKAADSVWDGFLNSEVATQPPSRRIKKTPNRQQLLWKVYTRPGLPAGLRTINGHSHSHDFLASGIAFMAGGCQLRNDPVSATILTKSAYWAINTHAKYWSAYNRPAPVMVPVGRTRELRRSFGDQVNFMVAWSPDLVSGVRIAMENNCRLTILGTPPSERNVANQLQKIVDGAVSWQQGLSRLVVQTHNLGALIESLPSIPNDTFGMLSIRARRRLLPYRRQLQPENK